MDIKEIFDAIAKIPNVYSDLAQPSVKKIGEALETVFDYGATLLLPLKLKSAENKLLFEKRLREYSTKINSIPEEKICKVNPQIGIPVMDKLTYTTDEDIADLFTTLLSKASSVDTLDQAHPGFVQLIDKISSDEARIIKHLNKNIGFIPFISVHGNMQNGVGYTRLKERLTSLPFEVNLTFPTNILAYYSNFTSMGILEIPFGSHKPDNALYDKILSLYKYTDLENTFNKQKIFKSITTQKGCYDITDYGQLFIRACNWKS